MSCSLPTHYSRVSNRRGGQNKRGGWQKSPKLINGEAGKSTASRNFSEIKSSNDLGSKYVVAVHGL